MFNNDSGNFQYWNARGPVATITLNRPECHNALDREVSAELNAAVKEISVERGCRIVILRGAGDTFLRAGDDVKEFNNWEPTDFIPVRSPSSRGGEKPRSGTSSAV